MIGKYYNNYDDDDYDDDDDDRFYLVEEESEKEEENLSINDLNEEAMEGNLRALEMCWFITISSAKCEYKLAVISILSIRLSKTTVEIKYFDKNKYYDLEFITSAGKFVCKGVYYGDERYRRFSDLKSWIDDIKLIQCESVEFIPWVSMQNCNPDNDNHANQLNPNNAEYNHSRCKN